MFGRILKYKKVALRQKNVAIQLMFFDTWQKSAAGF